MEVALPFVSVGEMDALLDQARAGAKAATALDVVKHKLTQRRDNLYRKFLNEQDISKLVNYQSELRAIELLAQGLLVDSRQGDIAYEALMATRQSVEPGTEISERPTPLVPERPRSVGRRKASATTRKAA